MIKLDVVNEKVLRKASPEECERFSRQRDERARREATQEVRQRKLFKAKLMKRTKSKLCEMLMDTSEENDRYESLISDNYRNMPKLEELQTDVSFWQDLAQKYGNIATTLTNRILGAD